MKTPQKNLTDQIEQRIYLYIREHDLAYGDALPKEEELAATLNASRTITREALSRLKAAGIIESRRRRGMILKKPDLFSGLDKIIHHGLLDETTQKDFAELRLVIELGLADIIYRNQTAEACDILMQSAREFHNQDMTPELHLQLEQQFHRRLFALSGNQVIERFQLLLEPFFAQSDNINWTPEKSRQSGDDHMGLVKALRNGSLQEWREALHNHFAHYFF